MDNLLGDLRQALRMVARNPGFSILMIVILGIGIAATTSMVTVLDSVLYREIPFKDPGRLVIVWTKSLKTAWMDEEMVSPSILADWRLGNHSFQDLAAFTWLQSYNISGDEVPQRIRGARVTENLLSTLGVQPALGRVFTGEDLKTENGHVALIGYGLWKSRFGGSNSIISKTIRLNGEMYTVVGVLPARFQLVFLPPADVIIPLNPTLSEQEDRNSHLLCVVGRLRPGVAIGEAAKDLDSLAARLGAQYPAEAAWGINPVLLREEGTHDVRSKFSIFLGIALLILMIACANMANLLLSRVLRRSGELAVRIALGVMRFRLLRQLLFESFILVLSAGLLSLGASYFIAEQLLRHSPVYFPPGTHIRIDWRTFAICMAISVLMGILFTLVPALSAMKLNISQLLSLSSTRTAGRSGARALLQRNLVILEVGLSFILLIAAGLMLQTLVKIERVKLGFNPDNLMSFQISLAKTKYSQSVSQANYYRNLLERIRVIPGVESCTAVSHIPLSMSGMNNYFRPKGTFLGSQDQQPNIASRVVMPNYFSTMKIKLLNGRLFSDKGESTPVTVISQKLAERYFPGEDPVGQPLFVLRPLQADVDSVPAGPREIIGVVEDVRELGPEKDPWPEAYFSFEQMPVPSLAVVLRMKSAGGVLTGVQKQAMDMDPDQPVYNVRTMDELLSRVTDARRFQVASVAVFAGIALILAVSGLYSVISYSVLQRKQEIGIRIALGAQHAKVVRLIVTEGIRMGGIGVVLGAIGALLLTRFIQTLLYQTSPNDPLTFVIAVLLLTAVVITASYIPARRASRLEPSTVLRSE